ncbi:hypothetical protein V2G26_011313 [Clonostachys chloroleuca]
MSTTTTLQAAPVALQSSISPPSTKQPVLREQQQETPLTSSHESSDETDGSLGPRKQYSRLQQAAVTFQLSAVNLASSCTNGLIVISLPQLTADLSLPSSLAFWPSSVAGLTTASTLLIAGSLADVLGHRAIALAGMLTCGLFMISCGLVHRGEDFVILRALYGIGLSMHLASSIGLVTKLLPRGRGRNVAFACLGFSQPLGFCLGLIAGGVLVDTIGWRAGWYIYGGFTLAMFVMSIFSLPKSEPLGSVKEVIRNMKAKVDWLGTLLASAFMALLCYFLAMISTDINRVKEPLSIAFLVIGVLCLPLFLGWMHRQVSTGKPALIPNSFWRIASFSSICATIALSYAVINSLELFVSLFFQEVQHLSALSSAIRMIPSFVVGIILNLITGIFVHRVPAIWIVTVSCVLTAGSPLLMAVIQPHWSYWANAFVAQLLMPVCADVIFVIGMLVVSETFPEDKQALAGAVFNTAAQFGNACGLAIMQVISMVVAKGHEGMSPVDALMQGYRASFWSMFGFMVFCAFLSGFGLRKAGKLGVKTD